MRSIRVVHGCRVDSWATYAQVVSAIMHPPNTFLAETNLVHNPASSITRCRSYILAYNSHQLKEVFNVHALDLKAVARSFGFETPPKVCCGG